MSDNIYDVRTTFRDSVTPVMQALPDIASRSASIAINDTMRRSGMKLLQKDITEQVAFPQGYLTGDRLYIEQFASPGNLEGIIAARARATSLSRFALAGQTPAIAGKTLGSASGSHIGKLGIKGPRSVIGGVNLMVKPGHLVFMQRAFLVRLMRGATLTQDNYNIGLAIRLKKGESLHNKYAQRAVELTDGVYVLYGPSVDQVFREVAELDAEPIMDLVETEFFRQFDRLTNDEARSI